MAIFDKILSLEDIVTIFNWKGVAYLLSTLILFWIGKKVYDLVTPFSVDEELTTTDNKALSVSFGGYIFALGLIIWGVLASPSVGFMQDIIETGVWSAIGIVLLQVSRIVNDKIILARFDNTKELITDKNVGTGAVEAGTYIGTAFIIKSIVEGESTTLLNDIASTVIFFIVAQILFVIFGKFYQAVTNYDLFGEIEKDNEAAGVSFGLTLIAVGILLSGAIKYSDSLVYLVVWFIIGCVLLIISRKITDRLIFPKHKIDSEVSEDRNWGVALIEGGSLIIIALLLNAAF